MRIIQLMKKTLKKNTGDATTIDDDGECENCEATPIIFCDEFLVKI